MQGLSAMAGQAFTDALGIGLTAAAGVALVGALLGRAAAAERAQRACAGWIGVARVTFTEPYGKPHTGPTT